MKNKKFPILILYSLIFAFIFISCKKNPSSSSDKNENVICPLKVGNYWTYIDSSWSTVSGEFSRNGERKTEITGTTDITINNIDIKVYYLNHYNMELNIPLDNKYYVKNDAEGLWNFGGESSYDLFITKSMSFKYPVEIGDSWQHKFVSYSTEDSTFSIAETEDINCYAKNEVIGTPAGYFECIVYHYHSDKYWDNTYYYYSPNIGQVALIRYRNNHIVYKKLLKSYNLE